MTAHQSHAQDESLIVWQDREIRFDVPSIQLHLRRGEREIDTINAVEDTKGNNGEKGQLSVTNLRILWISHKSQTTNLSIGLHNITSQKIGLTTSKLKGGQTSALYLMTKYNNSRFEFIFTSLVKNSPRLFSSIATVIKSYESSKLYRDLKLRGAIIKDKTLILLPQEQLYSTVDGVWNLSSDQGNLGTLFITNIRVVWHANLAENFNVSIPYIQMKQVKVKDSKFGYALVIETSVRSGGYILGFRIDPYEQLQRIYTELCNMYKIYSQTPIFGIQTVVEQRPESIEDRKVVKLQDDIEIVDTDKLLHGNNNSGSVQSHYYTYALDGSSGGDGSTMKEEIVFSQELGLAIEKLRGNVTIAELWSVGS